VEIKNASDYLQMLEIAFRNANLSPKARKANLELAKKCFLDGVKIGRCETVEYTPQPKKPKPNQG
jgi:hypothetical protein